MTNRNFKMATSAIVGAIIVAGYLILTSQNLGHGENTLENAIIACFWLARLTVIFSVSFIGWFLIMRIWQHFAPESFKSAKTKFFNFFDWRNFF